MSLADGVHGVFVVADVRRLADESAANERARIVAWLRSIGAHGGTDGQRVYLGAASEIESGAHLAKAEVRLDWVEGGS